MRIRPSRGRKIPAEGLKNDYRPVAMAVSERSLLMVLVRRVMCLSLLLDDMHFVVCFEEKGEDPRSATLRASYRQATGEQS